MRRIVGLAALVATGAFVALSALSAARADTVSFAGSFRIVQAAHAAETGSQITEATARQITEATARARAMAELTDRRPDVQGLTVAASQFARGVTQVSTKSGFDFTQGTPKDVWLVELTAPAQAGFAHVVGFSVVDAETGEVTASAVGAYND